MTYSANTRRAIASYGIQNCLKAFDLHQQGWGARSIAFEGDVGEKIRTTRQADAAINAGREIALAALAGVPLGERVEAGVGDDHDTGRIVRVLSPTTVEVAWDSGVRTPAYIGDLRRA